MDGLSHLTAGTLYSYLRAVQTPDWIPALARTAVPLTVGPLAAKYALGVDQADAVLALGGLFGFVYYVLVRALEHRFPGAGVALGYPAEPTYQRPEAGHVPFPAKETDAESVLPVDVDRPTQTDNSPRDEDGPQDYPFPDVEAFSGEMR